MSPESCIPIIPSKHIEKSLRFWVDALGFKIDPDSEMRRDGQLAVCIVRNSRLAFMLHQRAGTPIKPENYEGIRLYWAPANLNETRERLMNLGYAASEIVDRDYGQTEFFVTDDDGFSHCFGVATQK
jgi:catechol 2,3-dioxygenase-like lactoylglutathione lyase family enzyme